MDVSTRLYYQNQLNGLKQYLLPAFYRKGVTACQACNKPILSMKEGKLTWTGEANIHHKRYADDITFNDLALLCGDCHWSFTQSASESHLAGGYCAYCQRPY